MKIRVQDLMTSSGVAFGTSGARGLVSAMTDLVCYAYTLGFLGYLESIGDDRSLGEAVAVAGDLRPSTGRIMEAVLRAVEAKGYRPIDCGRIPSPAVALFGLQREIPAIMVTGSHIPDDRNGIKFNKASGEILKQDEQGIREQVVEINDGLFDQDGTFVQERSATPTESSARAGEEYVARYLDFFGVDALKALRVGVYQHSAAGRDMLVQVLSGLGAEAVSLGRSERFIPVDTEAIRPEDAKLAQTWAHQERFDSIVSADGDSDRPLVSNEQGQWLRGDVAGILCARFLSADVVCTPVSCNTAVEKCGWFKEVRRTRIGSPYVIAAMQEAAAAGADCVVGYEANGGFLLQSGIQRGGRELRALPTRDAIIVILSVLMLAKAQGRTVSELVASLPARFTFSDRLKEVPAEVSASILVRFSTGSDAVDLQAIETVFGPLSGKVSRIDRTDGLRVTFTTDEVIHLRPSGNAPEFRCYTEAATESRAKLLSSEALQIVSRLSKA